jgi:predicted DNA-binding transcriptional regulator AlpA
MENWQPVVGTGEIAEMVGISRQRVNQILGEGNFPPPLARLAKGPVWRRGDIVRWAQEDGRELPGEPAHDTVRGFICRCKPEGRAEADALLGEVDRRLPGDPADRVSRIISSLEWDHHHAEITWIGCDQWFGVAATDDDGRRVVVQCDRVEDGLAAVWKAYAGEETP